MAERSIKHIALVYEDGSIENIEQGMVTLLEPLENGTSKVTCEAVNLRDQNLEDIFKSIAIMGMRLGYFGKRSLSEKKQRKHWGLRKWLNI